LLSGLARQHRVTLLTLSAAKDAEVGSRSPAREFLDRVIEIDFTTCRWGPGTQTERFRRLLLTPFPSLVHSWRSPALLRELAGLRRSKRFDHVWVERWFIAEMVREAGFQQLVVDLDDLQSTVKRRELHFMRPRPSLPLHWIEHAKITRYERGLPSRFHRLVVCKEEDRRFFGGAASRVFVVPNGTERHEPAAPALEQPGELLFVGQLDYGPNIDAVRFLRVEILPRVRAAVPDARLVVVGRAPVAAVRALDDGDTCRVVGPVPDLAPWYGSASVVVVPIRMGSGTRLKVLEALSWGKAVVATRVGAEGLDLRPGLDLELADTPDAFAAACSRLLQDPAARARLGEEGRARALARYDWNMVEEAADRALTA
jgi:glycosyltransferase involved in cell wall biosynthesis